MCQDSEGLRPQINGTLPTLPSQFSILSSRTFCNQAAKSLPEQAAPQIIRMMPTGVVGLKMVIPGNPMVYLYPQFSLSKWPVYLVFNMFKHIQMGTLCTARRIAARAPSQTDFLQGSAREALEEASMQGGWMCPAKPLEKPMIAIL